MTVAGFELTRTISKPSSLRTLHACTPEESNPAAWPMTIGPEPRMRILCRSSLRGTDGLQEAVELVQGVVGPRPGLGVVLDGRALDLQQLEALHRAVVEVDVSQGRGAEVGLPAHRLVGLHAPAPVGGADREAVVLRGDLDLARAQVLDRVVGAAVAEGELVGLQADALAQQLMAQADAPHRPRADQLAHGLHHVAERGGVTGAV